MEMKLLSAIDNAELRFAPREICEERVQEWNSFSVKFNARNRVD
jgi:hypothetical protein